MDLFDDSHAHTAQCWWDCDEAHWVCPSVVGAVQIADDQDPGDPRTFGDHIGGAGGWVA
jgi:hypothetical protein